MFARTRLITAVMALSLPLISGFVTQQRLMHNRPSKLFAKKKKQSTGQGFGKAPPAPKVKEPESQPQESQSMPLESIEMGSSKAMPEPNIDSSLPPEERAKQVLREKYGLKTLEEQQTDAKKREKLAEDRKKREEWKKMADKEDIDFMTLIPAPILIAIDSFLKLGVGVCTVLFVAAAGAIAVEAWSAATKNPLPPDLDTFIVNVVEPNFTPGLFVLLGFSVSLGIFASLQLGSEGAQYREDK